MRVVPSPLILPILAALAPLLWTSASHAAEPDGCAVSKTYIAAVQARDFETVVGLFAANAVFSTPGGPVLHGADEIGAFYRGTVAGVSNLVVEPRHFVSGPRECYFEIWTRSKKNAEGIWVPDANGEFIRGAIDHFTLDAQGKVIELIAVPAPTARMFR